MTSSFIPLTGEQLIHSRDSGIATFSDALDLTVLPDGRQVAVWDTSGGSVIWACLLDAQGAPIGAPFEVNTKEPTAGGILYDEWAPTVTARVDGGFMIAWTGEVYNDGYNTGRDVIARQYDDAGNPMGEPYAAVYRIVQQPSGSYISTGSDEYSPSLAMLADGRIAMAYQYEGETWLRLYADDGVSVISSVRLDVTEAAGYHTDPEVTALPDGGYVVVWEGPDGSGSGIRASVFAQDGTVLRQDFQVNTATYSGQIGPEVTPLAGGGFVVTWYDGYDEVAEAFMGTARAQMFDAAGVAVGGEIRLSDDYLRYGGERDVRAVGLPDGGFVAAFRVVENSQVDAEVFLQRVGADGTLTGDPLRANTYQTGDQQQARLSLAADGTLSVVWVGQGDAYYDGAEFDTITSRSFHAAELDGVPTPGDDAIVIGTPGTPVALLDGDDWLFGSDEGDTVYAGAGDDTLRGAGGDDLLGGADGQDSLVGDAGDDALWGVAGNDTLEGGPGNDTLGGGTGDDRLDGGAGDDDLWGSAGADTLLGGDGADMLGAAVGDDSLEGGAGDDALWGGQDNDTLLGGDGADTLGGFTGNDSLDGGGDADAVWGADGVDTLRGGDGNDQIGAGAGDDLAYGDAGDDTVSGGLGRDTLDGGTGDDLIFGGAGDDSLTGGAGNDTLYAGPGLDVVAFGAGDGADALLYFSVADDRLQLDAALWGGGMTAAQVVAAFGADAGADYILDFGGGDSLLLTGMVGITGLEGQIDIV